MKRFRFFKKIGIFPFFGLVLVFFLILFLLFSSDGFFSKQKPHVDAVFFIIVDTLRADRLSCYGYDSHHTHNIDRLSSAGITFTKAYSVASWTLPSVGAIMASCYPSQLGFVERPAKPDHNFKWRERRKQLNMNFPPFKPTMAEIMQNSGFHTAAFVNQPLFSPGTGFQRGFFEYYYPSEPGKVECYNESQSVDHPGWSSAQFALKNDRALVKQFKKWLKNASEKRIFTWLHLLTPHLPYLPPHKYRQRILKKKLSEKEKSSALYNGEILAIDQLVGEIVDAIDNHMRGKRVLIVFTSDHGEEFWEHGQYEHGHSLHREVIHIPLIIVSPLYSAGTIEDKCVRTIDILPTILHHVGIQPGKNNSFEGVSLLSPSFDKDSDLSVYSEGMLYGSTKRSLIENNHKLMYDEQLHQWRLYNILDDTGETVDISNDFSLRTEKMRKKIAHLRSRYKHEYQSSSKKFSVPMSDKNHKRALKALESLGYINKAKN